MKFFRIIVATALITILAVPPRTIVEAALFVRDLGFGDSGEDVRALQELLNADPRTRIAESGAGSPGQETGYFGERTRAAVALFQEINRDKILAPQGLDVGTGYVDATTRAALMDTLPAAEESFTMDDVSAAVDKFVAEGGIQKNKGEVLGSSTSVVGIIVCLIIMIIIAYYTAGASIGVMTVATCTGAASQIANEMNDALGIDPSGGDVADFVIDKLKEICTGS